MDPSEKMLTEASPSPPTCPSGRCSDAQHGLVLSPPCSTEVTAPYVIWLSSSRPLTLAGIFSGRVEDPSWKERQEPPVRMGGEPSDVQVSLLISGKMNLTIKDAVTASTPAAECFKLGMMSMTLFSVAGLKSGRHNNH